LEDVSKFLKKESIKLDIIILSGDIAYSSKVEEYELAQEFLEKLLRITGLNKKRLILVPGNHDVDQDAISVGQRILAEGIKDRDTMNDLLANDDDRTFILKRFHNYRQFIERFMDRELIFDNNTYFYKKYIELGKLKVAILGLNSALLSSSKEDKEKLAIGELQATNALKELNNPDLCIAVMHHPFEWLADFDRKATMPILNKQCNFILHGHLHEPSLKQLHEPGREPIVIAAGACFEKRSSQNSYNFVQIDMAANKGTIYFRIYSDKDSGFWTKDTITYCEAPDGKYNFSIFSNNKNGSKEKEVLSNEPGSMDSTSALIRIPLIPQPYFAHFFHLQSNFTGRVDERKFINEWFSDKEKPILTLAAIGGMGKSSLAWYWLNKDADTSSLEGVLWWSFYEGEASSFSKFLDDAIIYASGKEINPHNLRSNYEKSRILIRFLKRGNFLLILDGFERQLGTYDSNKNFDEDDLNEARSCIDAHAALFLRDLAASMPKTKVFITTRIKLRDLEDDTGTPLEGCLEKELDSFNQDDAFSFMQAQGIRNGTRGQILSACERYGYHPLSLRLLSGLIMRDLKNPGDIAVAPHYDIHHDLKARRHHIMEAAFNSLPHKLQEILSKASAFRSTISYDALLVFNEYENEDLFEVGLKELIDFGLLLFNKDKKNFDLHPIVRRYAYERLNNKMRIHETLMIYFRENYPSLGETEKIEDAFPTIELYYHTAKAGLYDEAYKIFDKYLKTLLFFNFGSFQMVIDLLNLLFEDKNDAFPNLKNSKNQIEAINWLAGAYDALGYSKLAVDKINNALNLEKEEPKKYRDSNTLRTNLSSSLIKLGELKRADKELRHKPMANTSDYEKASLKMNAGQLHAIIGDFTKSAFEINESIKMFKKLNQVQSLCVAYSEKANLYLLMKRYEDAYKAAFKSIELYDKNAEKNELDCIRTNWILGLSLTYRASEATMNRDILLLNAETYLNEALFHCRNINYVIMEPDILLAWAIWYYLNRELKEAKRFAGEALYIASRCKYSLVLADIYNFLAILSIDSDERENGLSYARSALRYALCEMKPYYYRSACEMSMKILGSNSQNRSNKILEKMK
jgi:predicted phosphodiesterase